MSLTTGGRASGATSTRSSPRSSARSRASSIETIPTCPPSSSIRRTGLIRICSFIRVPSWLIFLPSYASNQALPPMFDMFSTKKPGAFRVTRSRSLRPSCRLPRPGPGGFRLLCGTERWSRVVSAHFRLVWAPLQGVYENRWEQGFRQDDPLVRLEVVGRVGSFAPCCPGRARTATCPYPMVAQEPTHPRPRRGGDD